MCARLRRLPVTRNHFGEGFYISLSRFEREGQGRGRGPDKTLRRLPSGIIVMTASRWPASLRAVSPPRGIGGVRYRPDCWYRPPRDFAQIRRNFCRNEGFGSESVSAARRRRQRANLFTGSSCAPPRTQFWRQRLLAVVERRGGKSRPLIAYWNTHHRRFGDLRMRATSAGSISAVCVPRRWPETFNTSSTRPVISNASSSRRAPSPLKSCS